MKNIPLFTVESGIASLILEQITFNKTAYIRIQSACNVEGLLEECLAFCRAAGAEKVYATGAHMPDQYRDFATIIRLSRPREGLKCPGGELVPVTRESSEKFRRIYNAAMRDIPNAASLTIPKMDVIIAEKSGYFVYQDHMLVGIGIAKDQWIHGIVSLKRGMGEFIMSALNAVLCGETLCVEVIDSNAPAMRLYQRMGFQQYECVSKWYKIFDLSSKST